MTPILTGSAPGGDSQGMRTRRVICPLFSQYVTLLARYGSSGGGWTLPSKSKARVVTLCSPTFGLPPANVQKLQVNPSRLCDPRDSACRSRLAPIHGPLSILTST
jgi:hypothetical protein